MLADGGPPCPNRGLSFSNSTYSLFRRLVARISERALADLLDRRDAGQRQKEAEVVWEVGVRTRDRVSLRVQVLSLESLSVGGENELCFRLDRRGARLFEVLQGSA